MLPPDATQQPPCGVTPMYDWSQTAGSTAGPPNYGFTSPSDAYASAVANIPPSTNGWAPYAPNPLGISGANSPGSPPPNVTYDATANYGQYYIAFYSGTCYLHVYWQETFTTTVVSYTGGISQPVQTTSTTTRDREFEWTGETHDSGICLPDNFDLSDPTTWPQTDTYNVTTSDLEPSCPAPPGVGSNVAGTVYATMVFGIGQLRYSQVRGYVPPVDGSANGFPV